MNPIQIESPSSYFRCHIRNHDVDALYNSIVGTNLMSDEFVLAFLDRKLKRPSGSLVISYGVLKNMSFWHGDVKVHMKFHVFGDLNFNFLIGHPIKALLKNAPKSGCLNIIIGKESLLIPITRSTNYLVEDPPIIEPTEEVMATSILDLPDSALKGDVEGNTEEVIEEDEDSDETFELPEFEKPS